MFLFLFFCGQPSESEVPQVIPPPPDIQPVIDKLAKYVAKNGNDFEDSVRSKTDPRFDFLLPWHKYNAYYVQKKKMYVKEMGGKVEETDELQENTKKGCFSNYYYYYYSILVF